MVKGLTKHGLGKLGNVDEFVEKSAKYGFGAVDLDGETLMNWVGRRGMRRCGSRLAKNDVVIGSLDLSINWREDEAGFVRGLEQLAREACTAADLGCEVCCTYVLPSVDQNPAHFSAVAIRRLRIVAQVLGAYGMKLGLEYVSPYHLRTAWKHPLLWDSKEMLHWVDAIDERNVGLLLDPFHWHCAGETVDDIRRLKAEQVVHVHFNDAPGLPVPELKDNERLYPGEGCIDLEGFVAALCDIGYKGVVAQEVLRPEPPKDSVDRVLEKSSKAYSRYF